MKIKTFLKASHREYRPFINNGTGVQAILPVIITDQGVLDQFARYMYLNRSKSRSWQDSATFAVQLLLEYLDAKQIFFESPSSLFMAFSDALHTGTIEGYEDPSRLWWQPRQPEDASKLIGHITRFSDWLALITENNKILLNPWRQATGHEQRLNWAAYSHRRDNAFLSHLWRGESQTHKSRTVRSETLPIERTTPLKAFPDEKFNLLVSEGFRGRALSSRPTRNLRNILIVYLMHHGGLRLSEALSLWCDDVTIEAGEVVVRIYHPEYGLSPDGGLRSAHLDRKYGLKPRSTLVKSNDAQHLGWKNCLITDPERRCFEVFFYPKETGLKFAEIWRDYYLLQRVKPIKENNHPYAFTTRDGLPYSHRMFRNSHKQAVERLGLDYGKLQGTTPHGHRHAYGQRLARDGADALTIKFAMHHKSITSSQTYTQPTSTQMRHALLDLEARLQLKHPEIIRLTSHE